MGGLWLRAPVAMWRHPGLFIAVAVVALLGAFAAAAAPYVRAGVGTQSLQGRLEIMSRLGTGLDVDVLSEGRLSSDRSRRSSARQFGATIPFLGPAIVSSRFPIHVAGSGVELVLLARTGARDHVERLTRGSPRGVWISNTTAKATGVGRGGVLHLTASGPSAGKPRTVALPVAGVYSSLAGDTSNPYWVNWLHDIRSDIPDAPDPPQFVLVPEATLVSVGRQLSPYTFNRWEYPVDPHGMTVAAAKKLKARYDSLAQQIRRSPQLGCRVPRQCVVSSSLDSALLIAARDVAADSPTISLLSNAGLLLAVALAVACGVFLVRRRSDEVSALRILGEGPGTFGLRTAAEAVIPASLGGAAGVGLALVAVAGFFPGRAVDRGTFWHGAANATGAVVAAIGAVAFGALLAFASPRPRARIPWLPWELLPLSVAAILLVLVLTSGGLSTDSAGTQHPRLAVFLLPLFAAAGVAGLAARGGRRLLERRAAAAPVAIYLAARRAGAARGLLVVVVVAAATAFGLYAYTLTLRTSAHRGVAEKAYLATGGDVQAYIDPAERILHPFPFPATVVEIDQTSVYLPSGAHVDLIAGEPAELAQTLRWGNGWSGDPRPLLRRLEPPTAGVLPALATPDAPRIDAVIDQGVRVPIRVVGRAPLPGETAGRPALLVSRPALKAFAHRHGFVDPAPSAIGFLWAKGTPSTIEPLLESSNLGLEYITSRDQILATPAIAAADRSFRYLEAIALFAVTLALIALLLYLQSRQRQQRIASALLQRMGLSAQNAELALLLEGAALMVFAATIGSLAAVGAAWPVVSHIDALPQYAPATPLAIPWSLLGAGIAAAGCLGGLLGALAGAIARRGDVAEVLRVA